MTSLIEEVEKNQIFKIKLETDEELAEYGEFNHLMDVCRSNSSSLKKLMICPRRGCRCIIDDEEVESIAQFLEENPALLEINLGRNVIDAQGSKYI